MQLNEKHVHEEVLVPAVCWSTSLYPLMQHGLTPVFVDCDPHTMNMDIADMKKRITKKRSSSKETVSN